MQAVILAGGVGRRLEPYTTVLPKPLMPLNDCPIMEIVIRQLAFYGFKDVLIAAGYLSHLIEAYFQDGERYGVSVRYFKEEFPLGTAGPIGQLLEDLEDNFLVLNGDVLTTLDFADLYNSHVDANWAATIAVSSRTEKIDFGVLSYDENGLLDSYTEKPTYTFDVSMGINVLQKNEILPFIDPGKYLDIPDLMVSMHDAGKSVLCYTTDCQWLDIGRIDDYKLAGELFEQDRDVFLPPG